jgi:ATP-dependent RNA helicase DeaD
VDELSQTLAGRGFRVEAIHGGMSQDQRERVMKQARAGVVDLLVATDVAARGIDIGHLSHVVNFGVPESSETYVHRIGRTGRAGREGVAITIAEPREQRLVRNIERQMRQTISLEAVPSVNDVRARKLESTRAALREILESGEFDGYRSVAEGLAVDFEPLDVVAAAVKLAHEASTGGSERDSAPTDASDRSQGHRGRHTPASGSPQAAAHRSSERPPRRERRQSAGMVRIRVGIGRRGGVRPGDLVGAIANESGIDARAIGAIDIADAYSLVEVDETVAERVVGALARAWLKGQRVEVALARDDADPPTALRAPRPLRPSPHRGKTRGKPKRK